MPLHRTLSAEFQGSAAAGATDSVIQATYDRLPYDSKPFADTHPEHLATLATLSGMNPPDPHRARILELGCAGAGNIIPLAMNMPRCRCVGLDLSEGQINQGKAVQQDLGLENIELHAMSIHDVDRSFGEFDYIVAHGVYSHVPDHTQQKILEICRDNMSADGVAFISYNTYPGWHIKNIVRDMMKARQSDAPSSDLIASESRQILRTLYEDVERDVDAHYGALLLAQIEDLDERKERYLVHEYLADFNNPLYFRDFHRDVRAEGLRYLADADVSTHFLRELSPHIDATIAKLDASEVEAEQYVDFMTAQAFRKSLVVKDSGRAPEIDADRIGAMYIMSSLKPASRNWDALQTANPVTFVNESGEAVHASGLLVKAALTLLSACWPLGLPFDELVHRTAIVLRHDSPDLESDVAELKSTLLACYKRGLVQCRLGPPPYVGRPSETPTASPLVRYQAQLGNTRLTNQRHEVVDVEPGMLALIGCLDGEHGRSRLCGEVELLIRRGDIQICGAEAGQTRPAPNDVLEMLLSAFADAGLLVA